MSTARPATKRTEHQRIDHLRQVFARGCPLPPGALGIGDDAAVLPPTRRAMVYTVDDAVEGVHFTRDLLPLDGAAERAVTAAVSDLAAMGASVEGGGLLCSLMLPAGLDERDFDALLAGIAAASRRYRLPVLGGNLTRGPCIALSTTVLGSLPRKRPVTRAGARPGDLIVLTGSPGLAALGLRVLQANHPRRSWAARVAVAAWVSPRAQLDLGQTVGERAHAMIDLSDGLASDAGHVARASSCALVLDEEALQASLPAPRVRALDRLAATLGTSLTELALHGGEDYLLLAALPPTPRGLASLSSAAVVVGRCEPGEGVFLQTRDGKVRQVDGGFDHFRSPG